MNIIEELDNEILEVQKKLGRILELKRMAKLLPIQIQQSEGSISTYSAGNRMTITLRGGDTKYAEIFDLGFDFPVKPSFNEYNREFLRKGTTEISDETRMVSSDEEGVGLIPTKIKVEVTVVGIEKPPSCTIIEIKKRETVKRYKAICEETGEDL